MSKTIFAQLDSLPEFLTSSHLVSLGLYDSIDAAYIARMRGNSPAFLQFKRKILYPKISVIQFIEQHMHNVDSQKTAPKVFEQSNAI